MLQRAVFIDDAEHVSSRGTESLNFSHLASQCSGFRWGKMGTAGQLLTKGNSQGVTINAQAHQMDGLVCLRSVVQTGGPRTKGMLRARKRRSSTNTFEHVRNRNWNAQLQSVRDLRLSDSAGEVIRTINHMFLLNGSKPADRDVHLFQILPERDRPGVGPRRRFAVSLCHHSPADAGCAALR